MALQKQWNPVERVAAVAGIALTAYGLTRRAPLACVLGAVGLALVAGRLLDYAGRDRRTMAPAGSTASRTAYEDYLRSRF